MDKTTATHFRTGIEPGYMQCEVPLGDGQLDLTLPDSTTVARAPGGESIDIATAAQNTLSAPNGPRLARRVDPGDTVAIVVTDGTRSTPDIALLDAMLAELERGGVVREQVSIVVGLGLHRPMQEDELEAMLGEHADLAINHDPNRTTVVGSIEGCEIELFELLETVDVVCSTGMVEPHQYAGFSGGAKTVVIGAGGESQIRYTHGPEMLARDSVRLGRIDSNPFRSFLDEAGDLVPVEFCLNVTSGPSGIFGVSAGDPRAVVRELADLAIDSLSVQVSGSYDTVVAGVGAPKDANLYQATRAATYIALGAHNPLVPGGKIVIPALLSEGAGQGTGEKRFYEWLSNASDAKSLYTEMKNGYEPGSQRAFVVAKTLVDHDIVVTNSEQPAVVDASLMESANTVEEVVGDDERVLVLPDSLNTLLTD